MKIAIVGSRNMSRYGREIINKFLISNFQLPKYELVTINVMGCNREIINKCRENNIKIKIFEGENFEKINDDVANYADLLLIIEGGKNSGTILLANKFVEKNKLVYCVPGRINDDNSYACNWLISQGAIPLIDFCITL